MTAVPSALQTARHKHFMRGFFRQAVLSLPARARERAAERAAARLAALPVFRDAQTVALYAGMGGEMSTDPLFRFCREDGKAVAVPLVSPEDRRLDFSLVDDDQRWEKNVYGILEPFPRRVIDPGHIELLIVPGRAFTPGGVRLGAGGGYYDRFLEKRPRLSTAALAFDEQVARRLPADAHDVRLDWVVTPTRVFSRR